MKICGACRLEKELTEFHNSNRTRDGYLTRCKVCVNSYHRKYMKLNPDKDTSREWEAENWGRVLEYARNWNKNNRAKRRITEYKWRAANPDKVKAQRKIDKIRHKPKRNAATSLWRKKNRNKCNAYGANYEARKLKACPIWADLKAIAQIYISCPKGYHVDHIVPLRGKLVSGLHIPENLQVIPAEENLRKNNAYTPH